MKLDMIFLFMKDKTINDVNKMKSLDIDNDFFIKFKNILRNFTKIVLF